MKIGPKSSSSRRKFNKDHRSSRKAKNAAHDARVKLWRTRRKLLTHMRATSIRKYGSYAKVQHRHDGKRPKYMRMKRKNVPLPFSPLWTRNSPLTQYSYKRNEVRNPSAVYFYDSAQDSFRPIRKAKSTSFAEFIDWDRESFQGLQGSSLKRDMLKPVGWSYKPAVVGDTVAAKPLEPLQIDLPPITSSENYDDMDELYEPSEQISSQDYSQLVVSSNPGIGLEIYEELSEAGPLLISDSPLYCEDPQKNAANQSSLDTEISALDSFDPSRGLSSNARLGGIALRTSATADAPLGDCVETSKDALDSFAVLSGLEDGVTSHEALERRITQGCVEHSLDATPGVLSGIETNTTSSSGHHHPLRSFGSGLLLASLPSFAAMQQNRAVGERLAASMSTSSTGLLASLSGRIISDPAVLLLDKDSKQPFGRGSMESLLYPNPTPQPPKSRPQDVCGGTAALTNPKLLRLAERSTSNVERTEIKLAAHDPFQQCTSKDADIEMQSLPVYADAVVMEQEQRWSWANTFRSFATVFATAFLSPWRFVFGMVMRG